MQKYIIAISGAVILTFLCLLSPILDVHEGTAAWVQAVGSILAIGAATWIAGRETRETHKREIVAKRQLWESIATISENSITAFTKLNNACPPLGDQREKFIEHYYRAISMFLSMASPRSHCMKLATPTSLHSSLICAASWEIFRRNSRIPTAISLTH